jgi:GxxExxY protein
MKNRAWGKAMQTDLSKREVGLAMKVHRTLGCGFAETVYRNALAIELRNAEIPFVSHPTISVMYEGHEVGIFQADLIVDNELVVELKAVDILNSAHAAQLVNYLAATKIEDGLLLNFGAMSLEFRTKTRSYSDDPPSLQS